MNGGEGSTCSAGKSVTLLDSCPTFLEEWTNCPPHSRCPISTWSDVIKHRTFALEATWYYQLCWCDDPLVNLRKMSTHHSAFLPPWYRFWLLDSWFPLFNCFVSLPYAWLWRALMMTQPFYVHLQSQSIRFAVFDQGRPWPWWARDQDENSDRRSAMLLGSDALSPQLVNSWSLDLWQLNLVSPCMSLIPHSPRWMLAHWTSRLLFFLRSTPSANLLCGYIIPLLPVRTVFTVRRESHYQWSEDKTRSNKFHCCWTLNFNESNE